jgi:signal transduction histidine kinase
MFDDLLEVFRFGNFIPHGYCIQWTPSLLWTYVISDSSIAIAYYSIPLALIYFVRHRKDLRFNWIFVMFATFIFACGTTHIMGVITLWYPYYGLDAGIKVATAVASLVTASLLWPLLPRVLAMPSMEQMQQMNRELQSEISIRKQAEKRIKAYNEQLRVLTVRQRSMRETERIAIAREVHDQLGQVLTVMSMDLKTLERDVRSARGETVRNRIIHGISSINRCMKDAILTVQKIASDLRPVLIEDFGLIPALEWQAKDFKNRNHIQCKVACNVDELEMDKDRAVNVFRIFQEALTNVSRHARAKNVAVTISRQDQHLTIEIRDDGVGVMDASLTDPNSIGLIGMRERARELGGEVIIKGEKGKGTVVTVRIGV